MGRGRASVEPRHGWVAAAEVGRTRRRTARIWRRTRDTGTVAGLGGPGPAAQQYFGFVRALRGRSLPALCVPLRRTFLTTVVDPVRATERLVPQHTLNPSHSTCRFRMSSDRGRSGPKQEQHGTLSYGFRRNLVPSARRAETNLAMALVPLVGSKNPIFPERQAIPSDLGITSMSELRTTRHDISHPLRSLRSTC